MDPYMASKGSINHKTKLSKERRYLVSALIKFLLL